MSQNDYIKTNKHLGWLLTYHVAYLKKYLLSLFTPQEIWADQGLTSNFSVFSHHARTIMGWTNYKSWIKRAKIPFLSQILSIAVVVTSLCRSRRSSRNLSWPGRWPKVGFCYLSLYWQSPFQTLWGSSFRMFWGPSFQMLPELSFHILWWSSIQTIIDSYHHKCSHSYNFKHFEVET